MFTSKIINTVESHTEGMPTRVVVGGVPGIPGVSMSERRIWAEQHLGGLCGLLMREPRGHAAMYGAILQPSTRPDADFGVLYISASGFMPMCGHATMGVATVLVETGMHVAAEPVTEVRLDTAAGLVVASLEVEAGRAKRATVSNVPAFVAARDVIVDVPGVGKVVLDIAYGGNFYPIVDVAQLGMDLDRAVQERLTSIGLAIIAAVRDQCPLVHPCDSAQRDLYAVQLVRPATGGRPARNMVVAEPGYLDRSPCGTGTSARMALLHATGQLVSGQTFIHESILGTRFEGRVAGTTEVGSLPAIVPTITGRAWITGTAQFFLDPEDPFPAGFEL